MFLRLAAALLLALSAATASAAELAKPEGPVVLTVHGDVGAANRGPLDPFHDALFAFGDVTFDRAAVFDADMLTGLGMHAVETSYEGWPGRFRFEGPLLRDVMAAAGAAGKNATAFALDGYGAEITAEDMERYPVILALKRDGEWLGLGGRGPAWVIFPREGHPELMKRDDAQWVWAVARIEVN